MNCIELPLVKSSSFANLCCNLEGVPWDFSLGLMFGVFFLPWTMAGSHLSTWENILEFLSRPPQVRCVYITWFGDHSLTSFSFSGDASFWDAGQKCSSKVWIHHGVEVKLMRLKQGSPGCDPFPKALCSYGSCFSEISKSKIFPLQLVGTTVSLLTSCHTSPQAEWSWKWP